MKSMKMHFMWATLGANNVPNNLLIIIKELNKDNTSKVQHTGLWSPSGVKHGYALSPHILIIELDYGMRSVN